MAALPPARASETNDFGHPKFLGAESCASSGCHGGAGYFQNQFIAWTLRDVHHARPFATLTTARSRQIGAALKIKDTATDAQCVSCHAPLHEVSIDRRGPLLKMNEGVSCESCHGPAEHWLRSHTRPDYTHAQRVASGMRDLKSLYSRANACVACHQTVSLPILAAGHPELIFELDGQSVSEPKHWRESADFHGPKAWLIGQAVALREIFWQLEQQPDSALAEKRDALLWLLQKLESDPIIPGLKLPDEASAARAAIDKYARQLSVHPWSQHITFAILQKLSATAADFRDKKKSALQHARRAERLVLALDRLKKNSEDTSLDKLFALAQSIPDFDPAQFATALETFGKSLENLPPGG